MATVAQWVEGARPRTLPNAIAPVVAGSGAAASADLFRPVPAVLALVVAIGMIVGVNFANDYSDGVRGTDDERVGPMRLVGSQSATPGAVRAAAFVALGIGALAGIVLLAVSGAWWLLVVGAVCLAGAWFYTGGSSPYCYRGLGIGASVGVGLLSCAVLVANNLRDVPSDTVAGKRTLAVLLGERDTRVLYAALVVIPLGMSLVLSLRAPWALLGLVTLPVLVPALRRVLGGARGPALIPVLRDTGLALLVWAIGTAIGLGAVGS